MKLYLEDELRKKIKKISIKKIIDKFSINRVRRLGGLVSFYENKNKQDIFSLIEKIRHENEIIMQDSEIYQLYLSAKAANKLNGVFVEVGCYKGASSKIICEAKGNKEFFIFDTFDGLPNGDDRFKKGQFASNFDFVKKYLDCYNNVFIYKGKFPNQNGNVLNEKKVSFLHLDVDLYESSIDCLKYFYSKMIAGGIILTHDYNFSKGVTKAFDDFFSDKPETLVQLSATQCLVIKLK